MQSSLKNTGLLLLLFAVSFCLRFFALSQTPYANGWDGYFYINQVRSFLEEGKMDVPDSSFIYPLLILTQIITNDYILSLKIVSCILAGAFSVSLFLLSLKWSKNLKTAVVLGCFTIFSPHLTYFTAQYLKNLLGVVLFLWLLYSIDSKVKFLSLILLVINFFGHRVTALLSFIALLVNYLFLRLSRYSAVIVTLFLFMFLLVGPLLPGILNTFDIERFQGVFASYPQFAPYSFIKTFGVELISIHWFIEIIVVCAIFAVALVYAGLQIIRRKIDHRLTLLLIILLLLIFPFFKWSLDGPGIRLLFIFILLCPLLIIILIKDLRNGHATTIICLVLLLSGFFSCKSYQPTKHDPPYGVYDVIAQEIASRPNKSAYELIIAHKSLAEYIVYATGIDAMSWLPEYAVDTEKLWRVVADVRDIQYSFYLDTEDLSKIHRLTPSYCLVREDVWKKFIMNVKNDQNNELLDELNTWKNPNKIRPYFMLKNKE